MVYGRWCIFKKKYGTMLSNNSFCFFPSYVLSQYVKKNEMKNIFFWILSDEC